ncbi:unnamed protein product [Peniophora sp. CBMAI 1063]|nr:unnamed protein product [Peniophora sp. CBMAI 1063]
MTSDIWTPFRWARRLVFGTLSFLCLLWASLFATLAAKGWQGWTSTERGIILSNVLAYTLGFVLFYLMAVVVFRLWWDFFRAGLLLTLLSGASAAFTAFEPGLPCIVGSPLSCKKIYLITLSGSWFIAGLLVCYCIALAGVTTFAGPFRSFPGLDEENQHPVSAGHAFRISKPTPLDPDDQAQPAISPRTQQHYRRMGLKLPSIPSRTHSAALSWYNLEEQAIFDSSLREPASVLSLARTRSRPATIMSHRVPSPLAFPPPSYPYYTRTHAHSASSLSYASSAHSISTEDGRPAIERGAWAQVPHALSRTSHHPSSSPHAPSSLKRKPPPSLNTISAGARLDRGVQPPPLNAAAWMPVHIVGSGPSVHSVVPSVSSRRDEASTHTRRRRHPPSLTPGFTRDDWLSRQPRIERCDTADPHNRHASLRYAPRDVGARF